MTTVDLSWKLRAQKAESEATVMREALTQIAALPSVSTDPYKALGRIVEISESALAAAQANQK